MAKEILDQREVRDRVGSAIAQRHSAVTVDMEALTHRDRLELAAELIHNVLQET